MLKMAMLSVLLALATSHAKAAEYWAVSSYREPFSNVDVLRAQGHTVRVLVVDMHKQFTAAIEALSNAQTQGKSRADRERYAQDIANQMDMQAAAKALKTDLALRRMIKRLGVREVPALIRYTTGDIKAAYGSTDALLLAQRIAGAH